MFMRLQVDFVKLESPCVAHIGLSHLHRPELPEWAPGDHIDLKREDGSIRQFWLTGDSNNRTRYEIAVWRTETEDGVSAWIHSHLRPGASVQISFPRRNLLAVPDASAFILIGSEAGIAPLVPLARAALEKTPDVHLHYLLDASEVEPFMSDLRARMRPQVRRSADTGGGFDPDVAAEPRAGTHIFLCGPEPFVSSTALNLSKAGWGREQLHALSYLKSYGAASAPDAGFEVRIRSTGQIVFVPPNQTMLQALRLASISIPSMCERGVCGTCVCSYLDGDAIHRDAVLPSSRRQNEITPCVSRATDLITLDL